MLACVSELRSRRRWTSLHLFLTSLSSASTSPESTDATRRRPAYCQLLFSWQPVMSRGDAPSSRCMTVCRIMVLCSCVDRRKQGDFFYGRAAPWSSLWSWWRNLRRRVLSM
jgi:hypothetical protein